MTLRTRIKEGRVYLQEPKTGCWFSEELYASYFPDQYESFCAMV